MKLLSYLILLSFFLIKSDGLHAQMFSEELLIREYKRTFFLQCIPKCGQNESLFYITYSGSVPYDIFKKVHLDEISALVKLVHEEMIFSNKEAISERHGLQMVPSYENVISKCLNYYDGPLLDSLARKAALDKDYYRK